MTEEIRQRANALAKQIEDTQKQIAIVEAIQHCDVDLTLGADTVGEITIPAESELKDAILTIVLSQLNAKKGEVEDEYRML